MNKHETLLGARDPVRRDRNGNGLDDTIEPPGIDVGASSHEYKVRLQQNHNCDPSLSAGDVDAQWDMAESCGDETAGASNTTPDQNVVEEIGAAVGIVYQEDEELRFGEKEHDRDVHRYELDPASSEDYRDRINDRQHAHLPPIVRWFKKHWQGE
ncbi:MAG: DUF6335 family protein [Thermoanaerobaculia bacterium]